MKKTFNNLPTHQGVSLQFYLFQIDDFDGVANGENFHSVNFKLGNQNFPYTPSKLGYNICGNSSFDSIKKMVLNDPNHQG